MSSLFHISQEYRQIASILEQNGGELTPELEEALNDNTQALQVKASNIAFVIRDFELDAEKIAKEIERLQKLQKSKLNAKERLKAYLKQNMEATGITEIKCDLVTVRLQNSRASVEIIDKGIIPKKFLSKKVDYVPDKASIKEAIDSGQKVKGAELKENKSLIIK